MTQEQFDKMIEGLVNPSRIKVYVNEEYDFLMSTENTNDTMEWFKTNAGRLEENLRKMGLKWVYVIETCPNDEPFIYMLISPKMTRNIARELTDRAERTLPEEKKMWVSEGFFRYLDIDDYDNTPTTLTGLLTQYASMVIKVSEI